MLVTHFELLRSNCIVA